MSRKPTAVAGLTAALILWIAPQAGAAVTTSSIVSPTDPVFGLSDDDNPNTFAVSGTSDGTTGDLVDIRCYDGAVPAGLPISSNVAVQADGTFSVPAASMSSASNRVCRLRAVPAGTVPVDLTPFSGPRRATGERGGVTISGGPNDGTIHDYFIWGQQLTAANDYDSYGSCGLCDGHLYDSDFNQTTTTWFRNDFFGRFNGSSTRSAVQVDSANSYSSDQARAINSSAGNFPALTWSVSQNASNGNLTINESQQLVNCPDPSFPPDSATCPNFVNTGVRVDRTITQEQDGHLVFITDKYVSADGLNHSVDLLPRNDQFFGDSGPDIAYKFPGESSFSTHADDDTVSFPDSAPGAVYINVEGSADGATDTGQGAIVFNGPASPALFTSVDGDVLEFHQTGLATASCSPTLSFAYAQDYQEANVQSLAQTALNRFNAARDTTCSPAPPPNPTPAGTAPTGEQAKALKKCKKQRKKSHKSKEQKKKAFKKCRKKAKKLPV